MLKQLLAHNLLHELHEGFNLLKTAILSWDQVHMFWICVIK